MGKSMKLGGGGRFESVKKAIMKKSGLSAEAAAAIAANMGRKKYGEKKMSKMSTAGRKRAEKK